MASVTDICNLALVARLGQKRIAALTEEGTEAQLCRDLYPLVRNLTQAEYNWRFCRTRVLLAELTNDRPDDWDYCYQRPSDCLKLRYLVPQTGKFDPRSRVKYENEGDSIYSDEQYARAVYTREITDTTKFSPHFVQALSWHLAHHLCQPLEKTDSLLSSTLAGYRGSLALAREFDSGEEIFELTADEAAPDWHRGRY